MASRGRTNVERAPSSESRYTRVEFQRDFPDEDACLEWLWRHLYPDGASCPTCQKVTPHYRVKSRPSYSCQFCGHHVHPTAGTIFHKSSSPLSLWFQAIYLMAATRCGISAKQLERELGVTYKTAWRMFNRIRTLLGEIDAPLTGIVEIDETFLNPKRRHSDPPRYPGGNPKERTIIGAVERKGRVAARHVGSASNIAAEYHAKRYVLPEATVYTDESRIYRVLDQHGYRHDTVKHSAGVYVAGEVHTQTIDGFWSLFKRGLDGVYHSVSSKYLQAYVNEYAFRY